MRPKDTKHFDTRDPRMSIATCTKRGAVMALHGAQGPQLGLPQMISSCVQFGVFGAIIPIVAVCVMCGSVPAGQAIG